METSEYFSSKVLREMQKSGCNGESWEVLLIIFVASEESFCHEAVYAKRSASDYSFLLERRI